MLGWCGAPYSDASVFSAYDIVLSNIPELITTFQALGHQAQYFRHAFEPRILSLINTAHKPFTDCSFIGSILPGKQAHNQRAILIKTLLRETNIEIFCDDQMYLKKSEEHGYSFEMTENGKNKLLNFHKNKAKDSLEESKNQEDYEQDEIITKEYTKNMFIPYTTSSFNLFSL